MSQRARGGGDGGAERVEQGARGPEPGKQSLTESLGKPFAGPLPSEPGRRARTDRFVGPARSVAREAAQQLDVGSLEVEVGEEAEAKTQAFDARGVTEGQTIYLDLDRVDPSSGEGRYVIGHEVAHLAQQNVPAGEGGFDRDAAEAEAHEIGVAFAGGQKLRRPIQHVPAGVSLADTGARSGAKVKAETTTDTLPGTLPYQARGEVIVVRRSWFMDSGADMAAAQVRAPAKNVVLFTEWKKAGALSWVSDDEIEAVSRTAFLTGPIAPKGEFFRVALGVEIFKAFGPPPGKDIWWRRYGDSMALVVRTKALESKQDDAFGPIGAAMRETIVSGLEAAVAMKMLPGRKDTFLTDEMPVNPALAAQVTTFDRKAMEWAFGDARWKGFLDGGTANPIPGASTKQNKGQQFADDVSEADQVYFLEWVKQLAIGAGPSVTAGMEQDDIVDARVIAMLRDIDKDRERKHAVVAKLRSTHPTGHYLNAKLLETTLAAVEMEKASAATKTALPDGARPGGPYYDHPILGTIVNRGGLLYVGRGAEFQFQRSTVIDVPALPHVRIQWVVHPANEPARHLEERTYVDLEMHGGPRTFDVTFEQTGDYVVHAWVFHDLFQPNHFSIPVTVKTAEQRLGQLENEAFAGMGDPGPKEAHELDTSFTNRHLGSDRYSHGSIRHGTVPDKFEHMTFEQRTKFLGEDLTQVQALIDQYANNTDVSSKELVKYARHHKESLEKEQGTLQKERDGGSSFFDIRGAFLGQGNGIPDGALKLVGSATHDGEDIGVKLHDYTQLYEPESYTFKAAGRTFAAAAEAGFYELCKAYPPGKISVVVELLDDKLAPTRRTLGFDLDTGTAWKTFKRAVWAPTVKVIVNIAGAAVMIFAPMTAPFMFPALAIYNSGEIVSNLVEAKAKGTLSGTMVAEGLASIALNVLPYLGKVKMFAELGHATYYAIDGAMIAGQAVIMTSQGLRQVEQLRDQKVAKVAELDARIRELQRTNPSDSTLEGLIADRDRTIEEARTEGMKVFKEIVESNALMLVPIAAMNRINAQVAKQSIGELRSQGVFRDEAGVAPHYDPERGQMVGDAAKITAPELDALKQAHAANLAIRQQQLAKLLGTEEVTIKRVPHGAKAVVKPEGRAFAETSKDVWDQRALSPHAPKERPSLTPARSEPTFSVGDVVTKHNIAVGRRIERYADALSIYERITSGDRAAFQDLGLAKPPKAFDPRAVEWGLGELPEGGYVVIRGEPGAVDWAQFPGVKELAHSHPLTSAKLLRGDDGHGISFDALRSGGRTNLLNRTNVFPSAADISYCARNAVSGHIVRTPYVVKGEKLIGNPSPQGGEPHLVFEIVQPELAGHLTGTEISVYRSELVAGSDDGTMLWNGEVYAIDHPSIGSIVELERPAMTAREAGEANRPMPPAEKATPRNAGEPAGKTEAHDIGAVKGADVYPQNEYVKADGSRGVGRLNAEKIKKAVKPASQRKYVGDSVLTLEGKITDAGTALKLTVPAGGTRVEVKVTFEVKATLGESATHGGDAGPARFELNKAASGEWVGKVEIHQGMKPEDVEFALGHELDEMAELVRRYPGGKPKDGWGHELEAGVMKAGATSSTPTAHDVAGSREVVALYKDWRVLVQEGSPNAASRKQSVDRAIRAQGLDDASQIPAKLALLRQAEAPPDLIAYVEHVDARFVLEEHSKKLGAPSALSEDLIQHLLYAHEKRDFKGKGLDGGHHTSELLRYVADDPKVEVVQIKEKAAAGTIYRQYEQYRWNEASQKPSRGSGELPGEAGFDASKWTKSTEPKTTFDNPQAFLREAEGAWTNWLTKQGANRVLKRQIEMTSPGGVIFGGYVKSDLPPFELTTIFVEASWL